MRKLILIVIHLFLVTPLMFGQMTATIASMNGYEFCKGFTFDNMAHVSMVSEPPIPVPPNATITYTWTVDHANGSWTWHTNYPERAIPIPFPGEYEVQVKVLYVRKYKTRPFAAFWSNKIVLMGKSCEDPERPTE